MTTMVIIFSIAPAAAAARSLALLVGVMLLLQIHPQIDSPAIATPATVSASS